MDRFRIFVTAVSLLYISGCGDTHNFSGVYPPHVPPENTVILFQDSTTLSGLPKDEATIVRMSLARDILTMTVISGGGCRQHVYTLYGDIRFMESKPVQANVYLAHNANDDPCDAIIQKAVNFNLTRLKRSYLAQYGDNGPILLRVHEPGRDKPLAPFIIYWF